MPPIYVHIPSVRSSIIPCLSKWFVHAIEARENKSSVLRDIGRALKRPSTESTKELQQIKNRLEHRNPVKEKIKDEIHFVVVDNAAYYHEKPMEQLHTNKATELVRRLNRLGNGHGVYIHYITPQNIETILPRKVPETHPFFHRTPVSTVISFSPGGATNLALAYIRTLDEKTRGRDKEAYFLRMNDDSFPAQGKIKWGGEDKQYRNFFVDLKAIETGEKHEEKTWLGYTGMELRRKKSLSSTETNPINFLVRRTTPAQLPFYATTKGEDIAYPQTPSFRIPSYLIHAGGRSTWRPSTFSRKSIGRRYVFGNYAGGRQQISVRIDFVEKVLANSGINSK